MKITDNKVVLFDYTLKNDAGEVMDTSEGREPLAYIHGQGNLIPGLENALQNKEEGAEFKVAVTPEEGYGKRDDALIQQVELNRFEEPAAIKEGVQIQVETKAGVNIAVVTQVVDDKVTLDLNHPLADMNLHFDILVRSIREATAEEMAHGHVHGPGGHHH